MGYNEPIKYKGEVVIRKVLFIFIMIVVLSAGYTYSEIQKKTLFPQREYVKKQSEKFFKKVDLKHPLIPKVNFFASSEAYPSAYLNLTVYLLKNNYLKDLLKVLADEGIIPYTKFNDIGMDLKIENHSDYQRKMGVNDLRFYLTVMFILHRDYQQNQLSGDRAFKLWNILSAIIEDSYKHGKKNVENGAILEISSHLVFFKKHKKWQRKAKKILKKTSPDTIEDNDIKLILKLRKST